MPYVTIMVESPDADYICETDGASEGSKRLLESFLFYFQIEEGGVGEDPKLGILYVNASVTWEEIRHHQGGSGSVSIVTESGLSPPHHRNG